MPCSEACSPGSCRDSDDVSSGVTQLLGEFETGSTYLYESMTLEYLSYGLFDSDNCTIDNLQSCWARKIALRLRDKYRNLMVCEQHARDFDGYLEIYHPDDFNPNASRGSADDSSDVPFLSILSSPFSLRMFRNTIFIVLNWLRLFTIRLARFFASLYSVSASPAIAAFTHTLSGFMVMLGFASMSVWLYLLRIAANLFLVMKHLLCPTETESQQPVWSRAKVQLSRRRFQLLNDFVWAGINIAVLCLGGGAVAVNLIVLLYFFDIVNIEFDIWCFNRAASEITKEYGNGPLGCFFNLYFEKCRKENYFRRIAAFFLMIGMLPLLSFMPHIPVLVLMGASIVLVTTLAQVCTLKESRPFNVEALKAKCTSSLHDKTNRDSPDHKSTTTKTNWFKTARRLSFEDGEEGGGIACNQDLVVVNSYK